jgi:HlyD family secretion protein
MTVSVDLKVAERKAVLTLPAEVVRGLATETPWVLAVDNGRTAKKLVKLGIRGEGEVELTDGVAEGGLAVVPDGRILALGAKVRVAAASPEK